MKILDFYIGKKFIKTFFVCLFIFWLLYVVAELFADVRIFTTHKPSLLLIIENYIYKTPFIIIECAPFAMLISVLFVIFSLAKHNEIIAMMNSGISLYRLMSPIFINSFLISLIMLYINTLIVPEANFRKVIVEEIKIAHWNPFDKAGRYNLTMTGANNTLYFISFYNAKENIMQNVNIFCFNDDYNLEKRIIAQKVIWENYDWSFYDGEVWEKKDGKYIPTKFTKETFPLIESPEDFIEKQKKITEMKYPEAKKYIEKLKISGVNISKLLVDLYSQIATPLANFIIILIGIPFALKNQRSGGIWVGFSISILLYFSHWELNFIMKSLGYSQTINPFLAAWFANFTFLIIGIYMLLKTKT